MQQPGSPTLPGCFWVLWVQGQGARLRLEMGKRAGHGIGDGRGKRDASPVLSRSSCNAAKLRPGMWPSSLGGAAKQPPGSLAGATNQKQPTGRRVPRGCVLALASRGWSNSWSSPPAPPNTSPGAKLMESKGKTPVDFPRGSGPVPALHESLGRCQLARAPCVTVAFAKRSRDTAAEPAPGDLCGAISAQLSGAAAPLSQPWHGAGRCSGTATHHHPVQQPPVSLSTSPRPFCVLFCLFCFFSFPFFQLILQEGTV